MKLTVDEIIASKGVVAAETLLSHSLEHVKELQAALEEAKKHVPKTREEYINELKECAKCGVSNCINFLGEDVSMHNFSVEILPAFYSANAGRRLHVEFSDGSKLQIPL